MVIPSDSQLRLVIDGGKSKSEAVVTDATGTILARSMGPGLAIIESPGGLEEVTNSLRATVNGLGLDGPVHTACIGLNGVIGAGPHPTALAFRAMKATCLAQRYIVTSDVVTSYVGTIGFTSGVVIAAGTGSVILAIGDDGSSHPVDGSGPLCGDRGSGYDIGRRALDSALRFSDGMRGSEALHAEAVAFFGGMTEAMQAIYSSPNPTKVIASFSRSVAAVAALGDPTALALWDGAAQDLAEGAVAAARAAGLQGTAFHVATTGGLFSAGDLLLEPLVRAFSELAPESSLVQAAGGAILGGIRLSLANEPTLTDVSTWVELGQTAEPSHASNF